MLRDFLSYAAHGGSQPPLEAEAGPGARGSARAVAIHAASLDPLVGDLASRLRATGLVVHAGYGASAHRLDLAVEDPRRVGRVLVAVETDGPLYAAMPSTRDRDRLRIEQLRRLGWEHVRVWSTDLFRDPAREVARVSAAVLRASEARLPDEVSTGPRSQVEPDTEVGQELDPLVTSARSKPEQTRDDTDAGWGEKPHEDSHDEWLREQRPPHWG